MNFRFIRAEIVHSKGQGLIFVICVALSLVTLVAINSFRRDINVSLGSDARSLHGGDVIVHAHHPFTVSLEKELTKLGKDPGVQLNRTWEFYSVARNGRGDRSVLSHIKAVDNAYPLYGSVVLGSGNKLGSSLKPGTAVVAGSLLVRLDMEIGDAIEVGASQFIIVDTVISESERPVSFFDFGPRIFVAAEDLAAMDVLKPGSRASYEMLIKLSADKTAERVAAALKSHAEPGRERVTTYANAPSRVKRFFDNLLFFLSLISIFTMLLAGVGMQSSLAALLRHKEKTLAITSALGGSRRFLFSHYLVLVLLLAIGGSTLGLFGAYVLEQNFTTIFAGLLPDTIKLGLSPIDVMEGTFLGFVVVAFFSFFPLRAVTHVKPASVLRHEPASEQSKMKYIFLLCGLVLFTGLIVRQLDDGKIGLYFVGATFALVAVLTLMVSGFLYLLRRIPQASLTLRQALRSMLRPGNAAKPITVTLSAALTLLLAIGLVQNDLHSTYISSYPEDAPNLFCIDIQKNQKDEFLSLVGENVELFPVVRARLLAINDKEIKRQPDENQRGDTLTREFNLTYREYLLPDEEMLEGETLFPESGGIQNNLNGLVPVSILDTVAEMGEMKIGDILSFNIQGLPMKAEVVSVRTRVKSMLYPFFYFVFHSEVLEPAPQTFFAAIKLEPDTIPAMQNRVVEKFPNVSTINVTEAAKTLGELMKKLSSVINFFSLFSIAAGLLILMSSVLATRLSRIQEAVYYKILGANSVFVWKVFVYENLLLALVSGLCALVVAQAGSWLLCRFVLGVTHQFNIVFCLLLILLTCIIVVVTGILSSVSIIRKKPGQFLKERG